MKLITVLFLALPLAAQTTVNLGSLTVGDNAMPLLRKHLETQVATTTLRLAKPVKTLDVVLCLRDYVGLTLPGDVVIEGERFTLTVAGPLVPEVVVGGGYHEMTVGKRWGSAAHAVDAPVRIMLYTKVEDWLHAIIIGLAKAETAKAIDAQKNAAIAQLETDRDGLDAKIKAERAALKAEVQ